MDDKEFLLAFHEGSLPGAELRHWGHLRLAWLVLKSHSQEEAEEIIAREIRRFAKSQGAVGKYHETLTRFWVRIVGHGIANDSDENDVDELIERFPFLLEKDLPYRHWSKEIFNSTGSRSHWIPPDLRPVPA
jgi:hypothetical protein